MPLPCPAPRPSQPPNPTSALADRLLIGLNLSLSLIQEQVELKVTSVPCTSPPLSSAQVRLVVASPLDACAPLANPRSQLSGAVVLAAAGGSCALWRKARAVQAAGAAAVIFVNTPTAKNGAGGARKEEGPENAQ